MKKLWKAKNDKEGVSPVIATILMVAITVVLAAILMVMVMGMTGDEAAPSASITAEVSGSPEVTMVTVTFISKTVPATALEVKVGSLSGAWVGGGDNIASGAVWSATGDGTGEVAYLLYNGAVIASYTIS